MFGGPTYAKLKTNLRLAVNRLKLLEKKKTELTQKSRKEIADYISTHKEDRARIRVEHIIREDYLVEAYEILEMYCDMLIARFGLIQQMKDLDEGIEEAVNSILWAAPRLVSEVQELKVISDQLTNKYGKPFAEACRDDRLNKVNQKLKSKLSVQAPPKILVEKYMIEIAKSHGVAFLPDVEIMREDEVAAAEAMLIDFQNQGQRGYGWMYPGAPGENASAPPPGGPPDGQGGPPPHGYGGPPPGQGGSPPPGYGGPPPPSYHGGGGGGGGMGQQYPNIPQNVGGSLPVAYATEKPAQPGAFNYPSQKSSYGDAGSNIEKLPLPSNPAGTPSAPAAIGFTDLPDPPSGTFTPNPNENTVEGSTDGLDFDDLTKRFEELKKRK